MTKCHACLEGGCRQVPRLPRETKADVCKCHACQAKRRWMSPSATLAKQRDGGCRQVPRLPRKVPRRQRRPSGAQARHQSPAHRKRRWMSLSATLATAHPSTFFSCASNVEMHQRHTNQHRVGNKGLEQGRPQLRLQKSYQFQAPKTNPKLAPCT